MGEDIGSGSEVNWLVSEPLGESLPSVDFALAFADDALVLERGRIAFRGRTAELREDEALQHRLAIGKL